MVKNNEKMLKIINNLSKNKNIFNCQSWVFIVNWRSQVLERNILLVWIKPLIIAQQNRFCPLEKTG